MNPAVPTAGVDACCGQPPVDRFAALESALHQAAPLMHDVLWLIDLTRHQLLYVSPSHEHLFGQPVAELYADADGWMRGIHPEDKARVAAEVAAHSPGPLVFRIVRPDGSVRDVTVRSSPPIPMPSGAMWMIGIARDDTDLNEMRRRAEASQQMATLAQLASGIAHDLSNYLSVIGGFTDLIADDPSDMDLVLVARREIQFASRGAIALVRQLLDFARTREKHAELVAVDDCLRRLERLLRTVVRDRVELVLAAGAPGVCVHCDPVQMEQVLINLVVNARDAMPHGGTVTLRSQVDGGEVAIEVADTGSGIPAELLPRVFEPFFTTKPRGQGTGLGLATARAIALEHGGDLTLTSTPGRGTTFTLRLPLATPADPTWARESGTLTLARRPHETVAVVDDNAEVLATVRRVLGRAGYDVVVCATAAELLARIDSQDQKLDLLIADVVMPGLDGPTLARELRARRPGLRVLFVSGWGDDAAVQGVVADGHDAFLGKPFTGVALLKKVSDVLAL